MHVAGDFSVRDRPEIMDIVSLGRVPGDERPLAAVTEDNQLPAVLIVEGFDNLLDVIDLFKPTDLEQYGGFGSDLGLQSLTGSFEDLS